MLNAQTGIVDIVPEYNRALRPIFCVSEGDNSSRTITITVQSSGVNYSIPSGSTVQIVGKKTDNTFFAYRCSYSGYMVTVNFTDQMSAKDGIVLCELRIANGSEILGSANFVYWVEPSPIQDGIASESDLSVFMEAIAGAERLDNFYANIEEMVADAVEQIQIIPGQVVLDPTLLIEGAAADAKATGDIVRAFMDALVSETTAEAAIATCDDAAGGLPLKKLTAHIEPTQSGTGDPSPDNVRPISGYTGLTVTRTGKNQYDGTLLPGVYSSADFTRASTTSSAYRSLKTLLPAGTYTVSFSVPVFIARSILDGTMKNNPAGASATTSYTFTTTTTGYVGFSFRNEANTAWDDSTTIQIETGSTATEFVNYGATYPVTFPTAAGTVYGGTLTVNSDGSGTLTVDHGIATPTTFSAKGGSTRNNMYRFPKVSGLKQIGANTERANLLSNEFIAGASYQEYYNGSPDSLVGISQNAGGDIFCSFGADNPTLEDANTWLESNPLQVCYELETPTTYALSAVQVVQMLQGVNNIWTDAAGTVSGEYYASTALYVQKIVNAQKGMIAGVEEAMTATQNYSVGDLMIVGDALYKATAAISSGAALVVGTNIAQTTVAEQLIALANA